MKINIAVEVPDHLVEDWLRMLRIFNATHPGCRFQVVADAPDLTDAELLALINIDPSIKRGPHS